MRGRGRAAAAAVLTAAAAAAVGATAVFPSAADAQGWSLEARAGRLDFHLVDGTAPAATSLGLGLGHESRDGWFRVSTGVPMGEEDPLWGALDVGQRAAVERGPLTVGVDLAGQGFVQRYEQRLEEGPGLPWQRPLEEGTAWGHGAAAQALPVVALDLGRATVQARAGGSWYRSGLDGGDATRAVGVAELRTSVRPHPTIALSGDARHYAAPEGGQTFAGVSAMMVRSSVSVWGSVGQWLGDAAEGTAVEGTPWSAGASLALGRRLELTVTGRQDVLDPLYGSAPRRAWSAGLRLGLGAAPSNAPPVPAEYRGGRATIAVPAGDVPGGVRIAGDFTDWEPAAMTRQGDRWTYSADLAPGVYEYAFVAPDGTWFVPASVPGRRDDGMGGHVALLVVEGEER